MYNLKNKIWTASVLTNLHETVEDVIKRLNKAEWIIFGHLRREGRNLVANDPIDGNDAIAFISKGQNDIRP